MLLQAGIYILYLLDAYSSGWVMLIIALLQCLSISLAYGTWVHIFIRVFNISYQTHFETSGVVYNTTANIAKNVALLNSKRLEKHILQSC